MISFTVPGKPHGKQSVQNVPLLSCSKCSRRGFHWSRLPSSKRVCQCGCDRLWFEGMVQYTPTASRKAIEDVVTFARLAAAAAGQTELISGPVAVAAIAHFEIAKSRRKGAAALEDGQPHDQKPDADNLSKTFLDGIKQGYLIVDDCQVSDLSIKKRWTTGTSRLEVAIEPSSARLS